MKPNFLYRLGQLILAISLCVLLTQSHALAVTIVLKKPAPLNTESLNYLRKASNQDTDQWKLVVFGFTQCKDVCPMSLANFSMLVAAAEKQNIKLDGTFVTVDPDRDTEKVLSGYTENFGPNISHLRLQDDALEKFKSTFGVEAVFYTKNAGNKINYQVDHSSTAFLIDPNGKIRVLFDALENAADIEKMLRENQAFFKS